MLYSPHPDDRLLLAREHVEALRRDARRGEPSTGSRLRAVSFRLRRNSSDPVAHVSIALGSGRQS